MKKGKAWLKKSETTITFTKHMLSNLSIIVRTDQFGYFNKLTRPKKTSKVLDVGVSSNETLKDSNMFEKLYKYRNKLTAATIEDLHKFKKLYPDIRAIKIYPKRRLPFKDKEFDVVTAWATLEHVGGYKDQEFFLNELLRVGKKIFITTPYRGCIYEPHTGIFFLHWLPLSIFRNLCKHLDKTFWSDKENLNPLYVKDVKRFALSRKVNILVYNTLRLLPTHLIISN